MAAMRVAKSVYYTVIDTFYRPVVSVSVPVERLVFPPIRPPAGTITKGDCLWITRPAALRAGARP